MSQLKSQDGVKRLVVCCDRLADTIPGQAWRAGGIGSPGQVFPAWLGAKKSRKHWVSAFASKAG